MSNRMKDMTPYFHCPFCPRKHATWNELMFHIGSWHEPQDTLDDERLGLCEKALSEIEWEQSEQFVVMILSQEWIEVLRSNVN